MLLFRIWMQHEARIEWRFSRNWNFPLRFSIFFCAQLCCFYSSSVRRLEGTFSRIQFAYISNRDRIGATEYISKIDSVDDWARTPHTHKSLSHSHLFAHTHNERLLLFLRTTSNAISFGGFFSPHVTSLCFRYHSSFIRLIQTKMNETRNVGIAVIIILQCMYVTHYCRSSEHEFRKNVFFSRLQIWWKHNHVICAEIASVVSVSNQVINSKCDR